MEFYRGSRARKEMAGEGMFRALWTVVNRNKRRYGGYFVHLGIVLIFVGITGNAFKLEKQATVKKGESFNIKSYTLRYDSLARYPTANKEVVVASLSMFNSGSKTAVLTPEKNLHRGQDQPTTEVAIHSNLKEDLYVILAGYEGDVATFKVLVTPLVIWIWIGGTTMAMGTIFAMFPNRKKGRSVVHQAPDEEATP
jgi:cytochrome c-type biogenesis protein CcmF